MTDALRVECQVQVRPIRKAPQRPRSWERKPLANLQYALILGHQIVWAMERGSFTSQPQVGRHLGFTAMRVSQLVAFTRFAPTIQRHLLALPKRVLWRIPEQRIRPILQMLLWEDQVRAWEDVLSRMDITIPTDAASAPTTS